MVLGGHARPEHHHLVPVAVRERRQLHLPAPGVQLGAALPAARAGSQHVCFVVAGLRRVQRHHDRLERGLVDAVHVARRRSLRGDLCAGGREVEELRVLQVVVLDFVLGALAQLHRRAWARHAERPPFSERDCMEQAVRVSGHVMHVEALGLELGFQRDERVGVQIDETAGRVLAR